MWGQASNDIFNLITGQVKHSLLALGFWRGQK